MYAYVCADLCVCCVCVCVVCVCALCVCVCVFVCMCVCVCEVIHSLPYLKVPRLHTKGRLWWDLGLLSR